MNLKFYKTGAKPTTVGSLWFNPTTKRIELITGTSTSDVYGSDIQDATYSNDILTIEKIDGSTITINLSDYATSSELENLLANKLNKIKVNNSTVNSADLNIVGSGGTTVSNNSGTITISSETVPTSFDASIITSGTIDLERLPKGALERLLIVSSESDAMNADCQEGDTVQVTGNDNKMYFCVNGSATTFANKFREYTAGAATSVPWSGVTGKPNVEDGAQKNVQSDWNAISGDAFILNKPTIPTKTSQLTNDSDFATQTVVTTALATKANKTEVEPYNCSWVFRLSNGMEVTRDQYNELDTVIRSGRPLYAMYNERNSSVIGGIDGHSDDYTKIFFLIYTSYLGGIQRTISDENMVNAEHYMEVNTSFWGLQQSLVSGTNIKTINGVSVLGAGDIKTPAPTKVSELENDKGFLTEHQSLGDYIKKREVVKTYPDTTGYGTSYTDDMPSIKLSANKFNIVGRCGGLHLALPAGADLDGQEYCCQFYVANSTYTLTVPADVRWQNGEVPTFEGNTCCQLVIVNNCATIGVFKASS